MEKFEIVHNDGVITAKVVIEGKEYTKDVTEYFQGPNGFDDYLDHKLGLDKYIE